MREFDSVGDSDSELGIRERDQLVDAHPGPAGEKFDLLQTREQAYEYNIDERKITLSR